MTTLTLEQARDRCTYWQRMLRLQDWDIEVLIVRRRELCATGTSLGSATIDTYRRARIRLADPLDYVDADWPIDRDMEATLLHELVHLHLDDLRVPETDTNGRRTGENIALERATEAIARALLMLDRDAAGEPTV